MILTKKILYIFRKYEEICAPQVEEFCYITDNTYFKEEVWFYPTLSDLWDFRFFLKLLILFLAALA
jgi:hypothetical protein